MSKRQYASDRYLLTVSIWVFAVLLNGCAMGGGTLGTGLTFEKSGARPTQSLIRFTITGVIVDSRGRPAPDVKISVRSSESEAQATTDSKGRFQLPVAFQSGRALRFTVTSKQGTTSCTRYVSPAGEKSVEVRFILDRYGQVVCSDL